MKRKLDDFLSEARPPKQRFKLNSALQDVLDLHFYVGDYHDPDIAEEELAPLYPFEQAMLDGSEQEFRDALATLPDLNNKIGDWEDDEVEETVLMIAISRGFTELAKELIPKVDLKIYSSESQHALHYACEYANEEVAFAIIELMKDDKDYLNALDSDFMTPLFYAAWNGKANICKKLLELDAKTRFWAEEDDSGEKPENDPQVSAEYLAAASLDVETFKVFINHDIIRECGDLETKFEDKDDFARYLMACTLVEPFLLQDLNFPKKYYGNDVTRITTDGLRGDESEEPSVEEGRQLFSASCSCELMDLCQRFFPDNIEYQYYLWKYAIGSKPVPIHAVILGDIDMLKYLVEKSGHTDKIWSDQETNSELVQQVINIAVTHDNIELVKYVCEDLKLLDLLDESNTFEVPDATLQIRKYLEEKGGRSREDEEGIQMVEHFKIDPSLELHDDSYFDGADVKEDTEEDEDWQQELDPHEGPIMQLTNDTLIEILSNINAKHKIIGDVCKNFNRIINTPYFWTRYWTKRVEFAVLSPAADWPKGILTWLSNVRAPACDEPTTIKLANICATEGTYCYEVISLSTGKNELIERTFSETDPFVTCEEDETINFGDVSPITSPSGCPALCDAHKVAQFIPSHKITLKTIQLKPIVEVDEDEEEFIKNSQVF